MLQIASPLTTEPEPILQWIEIASSLQLPSFHIIGLASPEVAEARERVRAAIESSGFDFPKRRVIINLSPASIKKRGTGADLAMALSILCSQQDERNWPESLMRGIVASAELGLDGKLKPVGQLMRTLYAARRAGAGAVLIPEEDFAKARHYDALMTRAGLFDDQMTRIVPVRDLAQAWNAILDGSFEDYEMPPQREASVAPDSERRLLPLHPDLERWVRIAAAGLHHLLILGPRGMGKSHAMEWLVELQPPASPQAQVRQILMRELLTNEGESEVERAPVRRVSVQARAQALMGGTIRGSLKPGEYSLAHGGILIADELPEWSRDSRESLREPLERGVISVTRTHSSSELPARFALAANGNLCPCGGWPRILRKGHERIPASQYRCRCKDSEVTTYLKRLSGPVLDRIDIIQIAIPTPSSVSEKPPALKHLRARTALAQKLAIKTWGSPAGLLSSSELETLLKLYPDWRQHLDGYKNLSMRSRHKLFRVALSLAVDETVGLIFSGERLDERVNVRAAHFSDAYRLRPEAIELHSTEEDYAELSS